MKTNRDFLIDCLGSILLKTLGPLLRILPYRLVLVLGSLLGEVFYAFDFKHRAVAHANIKTAFCGAFPPCRIRRLTKQFYKAFGQNLFEIFLIPLIDKAYIRRYVTIEGLENIEAGFKKGKGAIFVAMHAGSWELSNIICANLSIPFNLFVREQKLPRLEKILNFYRGQKGCRLIQRENQTRQLIQVLRANESVAMTIDQGGRNGTGVDFFGKDASMASGAVRLGLKYGCSLIPVFPVRIKGPHIKFIVDREFELKRSASVEKDIRDNLQGLVHVFEKHIRQYPQEYLWTYKSWKYSRQRDILILTDGKTGHLRQAQALAGITARRLEGAGAAARVYSAVVKTKNRLSGHLMALSNLLAGRYICQGCLLCLKAFLDPQSYADITGRKFDIIISCGSSAAGVNYILSKDNLARSLAIMRPSFLSIKKFDLVVLPKHDDPPRRKNVVRIEGALNLIDDAYLAEESRMLKEQAGIILDPARPCVGLLLGGDAKGFHMAEASVLECAGQIKAFLEKVDGQVLVSTSRRTPPAIEELVRKEFSGYKRARAVIIANQKNYPASIGGILGLSQMVVTSAESISMVSEAVSSGKYVFVFSADGLKRRHRRFLDNFVSKGYIYLKAPEELSGAMHDVWSRKPQVMTIKDNAVVEEAVGKLL
ncbi:MAG: ELM1/GtrOC1 family putative glycosyltransferase [Candidatus Omnitrophica bacterium]|nr:ELM1/GtrOC1 family putative glycosyltransferase [Candidatus Omnitrophota bacterium]